MFSIREVIQKRPLVTILMALFGLAAANAEQPASRGLEEVTVIGTYLKKSQSDIPSPIDVVERDQFQNQGISTAAELAGTLTINTGAENNADNYTAAGTFGTSNINLRGLGIGANLVLLNGRRQTQSAIANDDGETFVDTASLAPMIAVERVEVLKDGASSLYGSDAISGVVNFVTRGGFEGFEVSANYQTVTEDSQRDAEFSALWGVANERSNIIVAGYYLDRNPLTSVDRVLPGRRAGDPNGPAVSGVGNPGNFVRLNSGGPPVPDPNCQAVAARNADKSVIPTANSGCRWDFGQYSYIVPRENRLLGYSAFEHIFSDSIMFKGELGFARNRAERGTSPSFAPLTSLRTVPAAHPQNPFGEPLLFLGRARGADAPAAIARNESRTWRVVGAFSGDFPNTSWSWDAAATYSNNEITFRQPDTLVNELQAALNDFSFNPFGSALLARPGEPGFNDPSVFNRFIRDLTQNSQSTLWTIDGYMTGALFDLPAGSLNAAIGGQYRNERLEADFDSAANRDGYGFFVGNPDFKAARDARAVFAEVGIPVLDNLELQTALRYEDYGGQIGDTIDPKIAILFRPTESVTLRGSFSQSFRAPSLLQANGIQTVIEPVRQSAGGAPLFPSIRFSSDPNDPLAPEEADVINLGVTFEPLDNLEINLDYWSFEYSNVIIRENAQILLSEALRGNPRALAQVDFNPTSGTVQQIRPFYRNASSLETNGLDFSVIYYMYPSIGDIKLSLDSTYINEYSYDTAQTGKIEGAGKRNFNTIGSSAPRFRINAGIGWQSNSGRQKANLFVRHISGYEDDANNNEPGTDVEAYTTVDLNYAHIFGKSGLTVNLGALNIFDEDVPRAFSAMGYDTKVHDGRQRTVYLGVIKTF